MKAYRFITDKCIGCDHVDNSICNAYINPSAWFRNGKRCPLASHLNTNLSAPKGKIRVGQQKQRKTH